MNNFLDFKINLILTEERGSENLFLSEVIQKVLLEGHALGRILKVLSVNRYVLYQDY